MNDDLNKDSFEDFLRDSLQNHSEMPSENTWDKIAEQRRLDLASPSSPKMYWRIWAMAASVVLLISALVAQHFYFQLKIESLQTKVQEQTIQKIPQKEKTAPGTILHEPSSQNHLANANYPTELKGSIEKNIHQSEKQKNIHQERAKLHTYGKNDHTSELVALLGFEKSGKKSDLIADKNMDALENKISGINQTANQATYGFSHKSNASFTAATDNELATKYTFSPLPVLQKKSAGLLANKNMPSKIAFFPPFPIQKYKTRINLVAYSGAAMVSSTPKTKPRNLPSFGTRDFKPEKLSITGIQTGLMANVHLSEKLRLRTGCAFENIHTTQQFRPRLKYSDGQHHGHGQPDDEHEFDFILSSGTSNIELSVRAEDLNQGSVWSPDDEISFAIKTTRKQQSFFLPLQLGYEVRKGRFSAGFYAGPSFQILKNDNIILNSVQIDDDRLKTKHQGSFEKQHKDAEPTILLHGSIALNLDYKLTPKLSVGIEPSVSKSFLSDIETTRTGLFATLKYSL